MLSLRDVQWTKYCDAMGSHYDAAPILTKLLETGPSEDIWDACWNHIVYQDDVGDISFAAVPFLVEYLRNSSDLDWNVLALISVIELARVDGYVVPEEFRDSYLETIRDLPRIIVEHPDQSWDELTTRSALACIAVRRGQPDLARAYSEMSLQETKDWLKNKGE